LKKGGKKFKNLVYFYIRVPDSEGALEVCKECRSSVGNGNRFECDNCGNVIHASCAKLIYQSKRVCSSCVPVPSSTFPCAYCGEEVRDKQPFYDCCICLRYSHKSCAAVDRISNNICGDCIATPLEASRKHPCGFCKRETISFATRCASCHRWFHNVCLGKSNDFNPPPDSLYRCPQCSAASRSEQDNAIVGGENAGLNCYFISLLAMFQSLETKWLKNLSVFRVFADNSRTKPLSLQDISSLTCSVPEFEKVFPGKVQHDPAEALLHIVGTDEMNFALIRIEIEFSRQKSCGCTDTVSTPDYILSLPLPQHVPGTAVSMDELVYLRFHEKHSSVHCAVEGHQSGDMQCLGIVKQAPPFLFVRLGREEGADVKNTTRVFGIDSALHLPGPNNKCFAYSLTALTTHHGISITSGHYTSMVKHPLTGTWWHVNDAKSHPARLLLDETSIFCVIYALVGEIAQRDCSHKVCRHIKDLCS